MSARPVLGAAEWFRAGERDRVEQVLEDVRRVGIRHLRTGISWADWHAPGGEEWYGWLLPRLAREVTLLPCVHCTPPALGIEARTSSPPARLDDYGDFLESLLDRFGQHFRALELWNQPNHLDDWDWRLDPGWTAFATMVRSAAARVRRRGWTTVLGATCPTDRYWLSLMAERGVLEEIDVVGLHGFPGTWDFEWEGWPALVGGVQEVLRRAGARPDLWITQTGFSTWRHDHRGQMRTLIEAMEAPVSRVYWATVHDLDRPAAFQERFHADERHFHLGLKATDGTEKLLYRLWSTGGLEAVRHAVRLERGGPRPSSPRPVLITGGAGFIGTNLAHRLLSDGRPVVIYDNLSRPGVERNVRWLASTHGDLLRVAVRDVRDAGALREAVRGACEVFHFAAQVAVTTSLTGPLEDFEVNVRGTLHLLEALRGMSAPPPLVFTSTNKVYGGLADIPLALEGARYVPADLRMRAKGVGEDRPLDFHSPYGCSKGAADQYILDYARTYGIPAVVFRMSCIYGPHQQGTEDQGWVSHFVRCALEGTPITLYGDGMQVRDLLHVDDLVEAFLLAQERMVEIAGRPFNVGGGPGRVISLLELLDVLEELQGRLPPVSFGPWRPGDQRYYVSDVRSFRRATGWAPRVDVREGVRRLHAWLQGDGRGAARGRWSRGSARKGRHEVRARQS